MAPMDEDTLIARIVRAADAGEGEAVRVGPGDDAALLAAPPGCELVWTTDDQVEAVHFERAWAAWAGWPALGARAAASSLSDLAAKGARPLGALLSYRVWHARTSPAWRGPRR